MGSADKDNKNTNKTPKVGGSGSRNRHSVASRAKGGFQRASNFMAGGRGTPSSSKASAGSSSSSSVAESASPEMKSEAEIIEFLEYLYGQSYINTLLARNGKLARSGDDVKKFEKLRKNDAKSYSDKVKEFKELSERNAEGNNAEDQDLAVLLKELREKNAKGFDGKVQDFTLYLYLVAFDKVQSSLYEFLSNKSSIDSIKNEIDSIKKKDKEIDKEIDKKKDIIFEYIRPKDETVYMFSGGNVLEKPYHHFESKKENKLKELGLESVEEFILGRLDEEVLRIDSRTKDSQNKNSLIDGIVNSYLASDELGEKIKNLRQDSKDIKKEILNLSLEILNSHIGRGYSGFAMFPANKLNIAYNRLAFRVDEQKNASKESDLGIPVNEILYSDLYKCSEGDFKAIHKDGTLVKSNQHRLFFIDKKLYEEISNFIKKEPDFIEKESKSKYNKYLKEDGNAGLDAQSDLVKLLDQIRSRYPMSIDGTKTLNKKIYNIIKRHLDKDESLSDANVKNQIFKEVANLELNNLYNYAVILNADLSDNITFHRKAIGEQKIENILSPKDVIARVKGINERMADLKDDIVDLDKAIIDFEQEKERKEEQVKEPSQKNPSEVDSEQKLEEKVEEEKQELPEKEKPILEEVREELSEISDSDDDDYDELGSDLDEGVDPEADETLTPKKSKETAIPGLKIEADTSREVVMRAESEQPSQLSQSKESQSPKKEEEKNSEFSRENLDKRFQKVTINAALVAKAGAGSDDTPAEIMAAFSAPKVAEGVDDKGKGKEKEGETHSDLSEASDSPKPSVVAEGGDSTQNDLLNLALDTQLPFNDDDEDSEFQSQPEQGNARSEDEKSEKAVTENSPPADEERRGGDEPSPDEKKEKGLNGPALSSSDDEEQEEDKGVVTDKTGENSSSEEEKQEKPLEGGDDGKFDKGPNDATVEIEEVAPPKQGSEVDEGKNAGTFNDLSSGDDFSESESMGSDKPLLGGFEEGNNVPPAVDEEPNPPSQNPTSSRGSNQNRENAEEGREGNKKTKKDGLLKGIVNFFSLGKKKKAAEEHKLLKESQDDNSTRSSQSEIEESESSLADSSSKRSAPPSLSRESIEHQSYNQSDLPSLEEFISSGKYQELTPGDKFELFCHQIDKKSTDYMHSPLCAVNKENFVNYINSVKGGGKNYSEHFAKALKYKSIEDLKEDDEVYQAVEPLFKTGPNITIEMLHEAAYAARGMCQFYKLIESGDYYKLEKFTESLGGLLAILDEVTNDVIAHKQEVLQAKARPEARLAGSTANNGGARPRIVDVLGNKERAKSENQQNFNSGAAAMSGKRSGGYRRGVQLDRNANRENNGRGRETHA